MEKKNKGLDKKDEIIAELKEKLMVAEAQRLNGEKTISIDEAIKKIERKITRAQSRDGT